MRARAVASQDIRAPNIGELATPPFPSTITTLPNPLPGGVPLLNSLGFAPGQTVNVREVDAGDPHLRPEIAHTVSFGLVLRSPDPYGLTLSVDHYRIKIDEAITTLTVPSVLQSCASGDSGACALISFPAGATLPVVEIKETNAQSFATSGLDADATWHRQLMGGSMTVRALANYLLEYKQVVAGAQPQDLRGASQSTPVTQRGACSSSVLTPCGLHAPPRDSRHASSVGKRSFAGHFLECECELASAGLWVSAKRLKGRAAADLIGEARARESRRG